MPKKTTRRAAKPAPRLPEDFEELLGAFESEGAEPLTRASLEGSR